MPHDRDQSYLKVQIYFKTLQQMCTSTSRIFHSKTSEVKEIGMVISTVKLK